MTAAAPTALVACVGNSLVADDAAGCAVYERLAATGVPAHARLELLGTGGLALLDRLDGADTLIVVDAVQLGSPPGTVHEIAWDDLPPAARGPVSGHGIGLREAIEVGRLLDPERMPTRVLLVGIEGVCFDELGGPMTPAVAAAIGEAAQLVEDRLASLSLEVSR